MPGRLKPEILPSSRSDSEAGSAAAPPLGRERQSDFQQADLAATVRLPWEKELGGDWILGTRMLASIGMLRGANETNGIMTIVPLDIVFGRKDGLIAIDVGGGALLSDYKFGRQNFGGPFQFVWTFELPAAWPDRSESAITFSIIRMRRSTGKTAEGSISISSS